MTKSQDATSRRSVVKIIRVTASSFVIRGKVFDNKGSESYVFQYFGLSSLQYLFGNIDHHRGYPMKNQVGYDATCRYFLRQERLFV